MFFIFEITPKCDFDCIYCYNVWKEKTDYQQKILNVEQIKQLFFKLMQETEIEGITISGGEPLLYENLFEVIDFLNQHNIKIGLTTHGTLLNKSKIRKLIKLGVSYFEISLDALNPEIYHKLTNDNQLDKVKQAILNIKKYNTKLTVSTILSKLNIDEIPKIIDLCFAMSVDYISLNRFITGGKGKINKNLLKPSIQELKEILNIANQKADKYNANINISVPVEDCIISHTNYKNLKFGTCMCGRKKWLIDSVGNLRTCEQNINIIGNIFNQNFNTLKNSKQPTEFRQNNLKNNCTTCNFFYNCGGACRFVN